MKPVDYLLGLAAILSLISLAKRAGASSQESSSSPVLTSIAVIPSVVTVESGKTHQMLAPCYDQYGGSMACGTVTWQSSNTAVATVSSSGLVTGITPGTAIISATSGTVMGTSSVTVPQMPSELERITISPSSISINSGQSVQPSASCFDQYDDPMTCPILTWSSGDNAIASVNPSTGEITGVGQGTTNIFATSGSVIGTSSVTVTSSSPVLTTIIISPPSATVNLSNTQAMTASCFDQIGNAMSPPGTLNWHTDNPSVATVESTGISTARVTGVGNGTAHIWASFPE